MSSQLGVICKPSKSALHPFAQSSVKILNRTGPGNATSDWSPAEFNYILYHSLGLAIQLVILRNCSTPVEHRVTAS